MIRIHQCYFSKSHLAHLDPAFIPFDNTANEAPVLREYPLLKKIHTEETADYWGMVSWRWKEKTKTSGADFIKWIETNPGYDLYHHNPFIQNVVQFSNTIEDGEFHHRGLIPSAQLLLHRIGHDVNFRNVKFPNELFIYAYQFVASQKLWNAFIPFMNLAYKLINEDKELYNWCFRQSSWHRNVMVPNFSFLMERLISIFLYLNPQFKAINFPFDSPQMVDVHGQKEYSMLMRKLREKQ